MKGRQLFSAALVLFFFAGPNLSQAGEAYGFSVKRPVLGAACPTCTWGHIAKTVKDIMASQGWDTQICWNCNLYAAPIFVAKARVPHDLTADEAALGNLPPPKAPVDFGITSVRQFRDAYFGEAQYTNYGPQRNLRLIAYLEDPQFLIVAIDKRFGVTDLAQIRERKLPLRIWQRIARQVDVRDPMAQMILDWYGITPEKVKEWGGRYVTGPETLQDEFDLLINRQGVTSNNIESAI